MRLAARCPAADEAGPHVNRVLSRRDNLSEADATVSAREPPFTVYPVWRRSLRARQHTLYRLGPGTMPRNGC